MKIELSRTNTSPLYEIARVLSEKINFTIKHNNDEIIFTNKNDPHDQITIRTISIEYIRDSYSSAREKWKISWVIGFRIPPKQTDEVSMTIEAPINEHTRDHQKIREAILETIRPRSRKPLSARGPKRIGQTLESDIQTQFLELFQKRNQIRLAA
jgi:hypothetical protein